MHVGSVGHQLQLNSLGRTSDTMLPDGNGLFRPLSKLFPLVVYICSTRTLYADCLLIHDSLRNLVISVSWKIIRFETQPESESEKEMSVATREAGRATYIYNQIPKVKENVVWTLNSSLEEHCKQMIVPGVGTRAEFQASPPSQKPDEMRDCEF